MGDLGGSLAPETVYPSVLPRRSNDPLGVRPSVDGVLRSEEINE